MSQIWSGGNKTTAINNIKTAVAGFITNPLPDGSRSLNKSALLEWVTQQFNLMITDNEVADAAYAKQQISVELPNASNRINSLGNVISKEYWINDERWPKVSTVGSEAFLAAAVTGKAQLRTLQSDLTAQYDNIRASIPSFVQSAFANFQLGSQIPDAVVRIVDSRFYIATFVTDWEEESAPSPVSDKFDVDQNDYVTVTRPTVPSSRNIVGWRLYRTNVGTQGAEFQLIAPAGSGTATTVGQVKKWTNGVVTDLSNNFKYFDTTLATFQDEVESSELQEVCPSTTWLEPPRRDSGSTPYLRGLTAMPNGVMAGFYDNTVAFCESYVPYGWPAEYQMNTEYPIVAMASFGQTLVVGTQGGIDYISGADAASMSQQRNVSMQACVSAKSMITVEGGVVFASPDGLCLANGSGVQVVTANHFTRADWQAINPSQMICAYHEATVYFFGGSIVGMYALHLGTGKLTTVTGDTPVAAYEDRLTDRLYVVRGTNIVQMFGAGTSRTGTYRTKIAVLPKQEAFSWLSVESDFLPLVSGSPTPVTVKWYGDGVLRHTVAVSSRAPVRLPAGRYLEHEIEVSSASRWNKLVIASTSEELKQA